MLQVINLHLLRTSFIVWLYFIVKRDEVVGSFFCISKFQLTCRIKFIIFDHLDIGIFCRHALKGSARMLLHADITAIEPDKKKAEPY